MGIGTDYGDSEFPRRFARSRALAPVDLQLWVEVVAAATVGQDICRVVDIGAGTGRFWPVFRKIWPAASIIAVDKSSAMLTSSEGHSDVSCVLADMNALPFGKNAVDAIFLSMVIHYAANPVYALREMRSMLKPNGVIMIRTGSVSTLDSFRFLRFFPTALDAELSAMPADAEVSSWLVSAGFEQVSCRTVVSRFSPSPFELIRRVWRRGFPSLQLVSRGEFLMGMTRLILSIFCCRGGRTNCSREVSLLVVGRT